ncbi:MAG: universal stress protein, partial [Balneolaceae bacterium]|nr:universal stress protein [Balneolaceae bacterium]
AGRTGSWRNILTYDAQHEEAPDEKTISLREQRLQVLAKEEMHEVGDGLTTQVVVSSSSPHEAILDYELNNPHDLVVMSTVGRTGIKYLMMGSTTASVVRHIDCPVLSINPKAASSEHLEA